MLASSSKSITINEYDEEEQVIIISAEERVKRYGIECASHSNQRNGLPTSSSQGVTFLAGTWQPGGVYTEKLIVRNVTTHVKKLKYRLPSTQYFSMAYPEPITLSPGLSYEILVTFKPVKYESYNDCIYFTVSDHTGKHSFYIPVCAMINKLVVACPNGLDLGYCPVNQVTTAKFELSNTGEVDAPYRWVVPSPFTISPEQGIIRQGKSVTITVSLTPQDASVFVSKCSCYVGENVTAIIPNPVLNLNISAIGKYAYISVSEEKVSFTNIITGKNSKKVCKEFVLRNSSSVETEFQLVRHDSDCEDMFDITPSSGILAPMSEVPVLVVYTPLAYGLYSCERYSYITPNNCIATFLCEATSCHAIIKYSKDHNLVAPSPAAVNILAKINPEDTTNHESQGDNSQYTFNCLDFGDIELGDRCSRSLYLKNECDEDVFYDIISETRGAFRILSSKRNKIPASSSTVIKLCFQPKHPSNYYRRVFILLSHGHPIFFDCYGTGYIRGNLKTKTEEQRPLPIKFEHVQAYRNRLVQGLGHLNHEELDEIFKSNHRMSSRALDDPTSSQILARRGSSRMLHSTSMLSLHGSYNTLPELAATRPLEISNVKHPMTRSGDSTRDVLAIAQEFFIHDSDFDIDLNRSNELKSMPSNISVGKLSKMASQRSDLSRSIPSNPINIIALNQSQLNFGYTKFNTTSSCQYINVTNQSNGSVTACWEIPDSSPFDIHPRSIDILAKTSELFEIRFKPLETSQSTSTMSSDGLSSVSTMKSDGIYYEEIELYCYYTNQHTFRLVKDPLLTPPWCRTIKAVGYTKAIKSIMDLDSSNNSSVSSNPLKISNINIKRNKLLFPNCYVDDTVYQSIMIHNTSQAIPAVYSCKFNTIDGKDIFSISPSYGYIEPEGFAILCIKFHPSEAKRYSQYLQVSFNDVIMTPSHLHGQEKHVDDGTSLQVIGYGGYPYVVFTDVSPCDEAISLDTDTEPSGLNAITSTRIIYPMSKSQLPQGNQGNFYLQPTSIGLMTTKRFPLHNHSRLPLRYRVEIDSSASDDDDDIVTISPLTGIVQPNNNHELKISFHPKHIKNYKRVIHIKVYALTGEVITSIPNLSSNSNIILDARQPGKVKAPELLQDLSFTLLGSGEQGALLFSPNNLVADVRLVNTSETRDIYLENISCSLLQYELYYRTIFYPDAAGGVILMDQSNAQISDELKPLIVDTSNGDPSRRNPYHDLFCSIPRGVIDARSKKKLQLTFYPMKSGLFQFSIHAKLQTDSSMASNEDTNASGMISNQLALTKRLNLTNKLDNMDISKHFDIIANVTARAAFPTILFQDIRPTPSSMVVKGINSLNKDHPATLVHKIDDLWKQFSFKELNYDLAQPLNEEECLLFTDSSPDRTRFPRYVFHFTPSPASNQSTIPSSAGLASLVGGPSNLLPPLIATPMTSAPPNQMNIQSYDISICNNGFLESSFHFHLPNEKELDLEMWCTDTSGISASTKFFQGDKKAALDAEEKASMMSTILEDMKYFNVYPMSGRLQPGESTIITVIYTHGLIRPSKNGIGVGIQRLPLLVKIDQGRQFYIDLIGKTLPHSAVSSNSPKASKMNRQTRRSSFATIMTSATSKSAKSVAATAITSLSNVSKKSNRSKIGGKNAIKPEDILSLPAIQQMLLWIPTPPNSKIYDLSPVPIGFPSKLPPKQRIEVYNLSAFPINYEVNMDLLRINAMDKVDTNTNQIVIEGNNSIDLIKISNPTGTIEARSSIYLNIFFYPLEVRDYLFPLQIKYTKATIASIDKIIEEDSTSELGDFGKISSSRMSSKGRNQSSKNIRRSVSRASSSRSNLHSNVNLTNINSNYPLNNTNIIEENHLEIYLRVSGYDPRKEIKPLPVGALTVGGLPPSRHLIRYSPNPDDKSNNSRVSQATEMVDISSNEVHFGVIPQYGVSRKMLIITNTSQDGHEVEYYINPDECSLYGEDVLSIEPMRGKIPYQGKAYIHFKCNGTTNPVIFNESINIITREVIRVAGVRRQSMEEKLKEKYKPSKQSQMIEHSSVICHVTAARLNHLDQRELPFDLQATIPNTVNVAGKLITFENSLANDALKSTVFRSVGAVEDLNSAIQGPQGDTVSVGDDDTGFNSASSSREQFSEISQNKTASILTSPKKMKTHKEHLTYSDKSLYKIRIRGDIYPIDIVQTMPRLERQYDIIGRVYNDSIQPAFVDEFYISPIQEYIPPPNTNNNAAMVSNNAAIKSSITQEAILDRQNDVREMAESILSDVFASLLTTSSSLEYIQRTIRETSKLDTLQNIISDNRNTSLRKIRDHAEASRIEGTAQYGVYYSDVIQIENDSGSGDDDTTSINVSENSLINVASGGLVCDKGAEMIGDIMCDCLFDILRDINTKS